MIIPLQEAAQKGLILVHKSGLYIYGDWGCWRKQMEGCMVLQCIVKKKNRRRFR